MTDDSQQQPDKLEKSLGDQATGADVEQERSLGDQVTSGDALSSRSDLSHTLGKELPTVELSERYEIHQVLGQGGMGQVIKALDTRLNRLVAIKRIHHELAQSEKAIERFFTEAKSIAALNHYHIAQIYEMERSTEGPYLVMEYVEGGSLLDMLQSGPLEVETAVDIVCKVCDALSVVHREGIVHRDIKPANILMTRDGQPKLTDFGLARQETADHGQTQVGAVLGTIDFMPPEQRRDARAVDARSDLWSLAATFYQMLTGKSPKVIRLDQLSSTLAPVVGKMLEEEPADRYATAEEFSSELIKGMKRKQVPVESTKVPPDDNAGVCPSCSTANDLGRKFCRGCRARLIEPCLSCQKDNPVWEDVCGECGCSQQEERVRIEGAAKQASAEKIAVEKALAARVDREEAITETAITLQGHSDRIYSVAFSPDGKWIASGSVDKTLNIWRYPIRLNQASAITSSGEIWAVDFSPDGKRIVSSGMGPEIGIWNVETGQLVRQFLGHQRWLRSYSATSVAFSPDGKSIISGSADNTLKRWDVANGDLLGTFEGHSDTVTSVAISPDGQQVLSGSFDSTVGLWSFQTGRQMAIWSGHRDSVTTVAFSPDGKQVISGSFDNTIKVWDVGTGQAKTVLSGHARLVTSVAFSPGGEWIASGSADNTVKLWPKIGGQAITLTGHHGSVTSVAFSPDGKRVVSGASDKLVKVWDISGLVP